MQIIGDIFNILLFLSVIGGAFTILSLLANRFLRFALPLWFHICGMAAYIIPLIAPGLYLIPPEEHAWRKIYYTLCATWFCGAVLLFFYDTIRTILAHRAIRNYRICDDERITAICTYCCQLAGLKKAPPIYFGALKDPACAAGAFYPAIILNEAIIRHLNDMELTTVICHEVTHIKRGHMLWGRIYDYICILNWFNPFVWIAKKDFAVHCEVDCDRNALVSLEKDITNTEYANSMIHLLELTTVHADKNGHSLSALGFHLTQRRVELIMSKPTKAKKVVTTIVPAVLLTIVFLFSMAVSRGHFYPYPAYDTLPEYRYMEE